MLRTSAIAVLGLTLLLPAALAEEKPLDTISCRSGTATVLSASKEATVLSVDSKGISVPGGTAFFADTTNRCIGVISIINGKRTSNGYCKFMSPSGDYNLLEWKGSGTDGEGTWKYLYGTGKWKGVKGGGLYKRIARGKPIAKGTYQFCTRATGTYELPE